MIYNFNSLTNHADLLVLLDSSEEYMIGKDEAGRIIDEVKAGKKASCMNP